MCQLVRCINHGGVDIAEVSDLVVILHQTFTAETGVWKSQPPFATGGRNTRTEGGVEVRNAYIALSLGVAHGSPDANIRIRVNTHQLPQNVPVRSDSQRAAIVSFPASFLFDGGGNHVELRDQQGHRFFVFDAIVHFRQNS